MKKCMFILFTCGLLMSFSGSVSYDTSENKKSTEVKKADFSPEISELQNLLETDGGNTLSPLHDIEAAFHCFDFDRCKDHNTRYYELELNSKPLGTPVIEYYSRSNC